MVNVTVSIPEDLHNKMRKYSEVKWSEVVRKALIEYIGHLEAKERRVVSSDELSEMLKMAQLDVASITLDKAVEYYERARELEWKRSLTTQAH
jgi:metal-responsive CopG/Arc/MetJ family transcriptional regulator